MASGASREATSAGSLGLQPTRQADSLAAESELETSPKRSYASKARLMIILKTTL